MLKDNEKVQSYLNSVCSEIRLREAHEEIRLELLCHIQEVVEEYISQGLSKDDAVNKAIAVMGDSSIVGQQLDEVHKPKPEWSVLILSSLFVSLGLMVMYFMDRQGLSGFSLFERTLSYTILGTVIVVGIYFFDYRKLENYSKHIYIGATLLLLFTFFTNPLINGNRWFIIGGISLDVVSIMPVIFVIALAGLLNNRNWRDYKKFIHGILLCAIPLVLIVFNGSSLVSAAIYSLACIVLLIVSGVGYRVTIFLFSAMIAIIALPIINNPYMFQRLFAFINPHADPHGSGYLNIQLSNLIDSAGFYGQGFTLEPRIIPELHTDFIFAYMTFTFGWIVAIVIVAMIVAFLVRIARIATIVKYSYAKLLVSGFIAIFSMQFLWYISMNLGLAPITDVSLPLISYGGSQLIINALAVGAILSIYRRRNLSKVPN